MGSRESHLPLSRLKEDIHLFNKLRSHLSFANVVAMIALFVALSGTSYAVKKVGAKDIRKNAVRAKHIKKNQVTSSDIKNHTIRADRHRAERDRKDARVQRRAGAP